MAIDASTPLTTATLITAAVSIGVASLVWWNRVQRLTRLRQTVAQIHALTEEILGAHSAQEILSRIESALPQELGLRSAAIFTVGDDHSLTLAAGTPTSLESAMLSHNNRSVEVGETFLSLPMTVQGEARGVLQLTGAAENPKQDELVALQHLANQSAIALQLLSQRDLREQLLRSEKLGVVGQLISSIAAELKPPLERIASSGHAEVEPALETLDRLISFGRPDQVRVQAIDLNAVLRQLLEFRAQRCRLHLIQVEAGQSSEAMMVLASRGPIEQSLLSLLVHAEQSLENAATKVLRISSARRSGRARIAISFTAPSAASEPDTEIGAWGLDVTRGMIESHGGELHIESTRGETTFTVDLPLTDSPASGSSAVTHPRLCSHTLLLVHPDAAALRSAIVFLGGMDQRAVPAVSAAEALECASRFRFDAILAARHLPDQSWQEFAEQAREYCPIIGLLSSASDPAPAGVPALRMPADESELQRLLAALEVNA